MSESQRPPRARAVAIAPPAPPEAALGPWLVLAAAAAAAAALLARLVA
jgi:hypothetical protein